MGQNIKELEEFVNKKAGAVKQDRDADGPRAVYPGRSSFLKQLTGQQLILELQEDTTGMVLIGNEVTDRLQYEPFRFYIQRIVRAKYAPKATNVIDETIRIAISQLPQSGFGKCIARTGPIAQILIDKYCDHFPLYHKLQRFKWEGFDIAPATLDHWVKLGMHRLELLHEYQKTIVLKSNYLQVGETTIEVPDHDNKRARRHLGYFWAYHDPLGAQTFFSYELGRGDKYPTTMLQNFNGYLQTDGNAGYEGVAKRDDIVHLAGLVHVRRKFDESLSFDKAFAEAAMIQEQYAIERQIKENGLNVDQAKELRLKEALPKYNLMEKWISANMSKMLPCGGPPKSPIGMTLRYTFERWDRLVHYMYAVGSR